MGVEKAPAAGGTDDELLAEAGDKKTPPLPRVTFSFEHVLQHVEPARLLSTSSKGMSATTRTPAPGSLIYGSRISYESRTGQGKSALTAKERYD